MLHCDVDVAPRCRLVYSVRIHVATFGRKGFPTLIYLKDIYRGDAHNSSPIAFVISYSLALSLHIDNGEYFVHHTSVFDNSSKTNYKTGQSLSSNLKICSCIWFYYWHYIPSLSCITFVVTSRRAPTLTQKGDLKTGWLSTVGRANAACASPIDWLVVREKREEERKRGTNLTCPKIEARYGRARIQMDTDERATEAGTRPLVVAISSWWNFTPSGAGHLPRPSVPIILTQWFSSILLRVLRITRFHFPFLFFDFRNAYGLFTEK